MDEPAARSMIKDHFDASNIAVDGGGPLDQIRRASEIYADDAVLEWPQGGERVRGKANIIAMRSAYPARQDVQLHRTIGCQDLPLPAASVGEGRLGLVHPGAAQRSREGGCLRP